MSTVPMFAPDGSLRDVPQAKMMEARQNGMEIGVRMQAPDSTIRVVPASKYQEAAGHDMKPLPVEQQAITHEGALAAIWNDIKGAAKSVPSMMGAMVGPTPVPTGGGNIAVTNPGGEMMSATAATDAQRQTEGRGPLYRAGAAVAGQFTNVPGAEQSAKEGDVGGVVGHMASGPIMAAGMAGAGKAAPMLSRVPVKAPVRAVAGFLSDVNPEITGLFSPRLPHAQKLLGRLADRLAPNATAAEQAAVLSQIPVTPLEPTAPPQPASSRPINVRGPNEIPPELTRWPRAGYGGVRPDPIPPRQGLQLSGEVATQPEPTAPQQPIPTSGPVSQGPRTLSGEGVLRQILTAQDNKNLLTIAKSRGINVTKESQLKPGVADRQIIDKIVDNFGPDELDEMRSLGLEVSRFRHDFGDVGPEAWHTLTLQTYFPDVKIPQSVLKRTQAAIDKGAAPSKEITPAPAQAEEDLTPLLKESVKKARTARAAARGQ